MTNPSAPTVALWTLQDVATHLGMTTGSTRHWLSRHRIHAATRAPGNTGLYSVERVRAARAEQQRKTEARAEMRLWVRWP